MNPLLALVINTLDIFLGLLTWLIIIRIFMSWLAPHAGGRLAYFIHSATQPVLGFFARFHLRWGMLDFTPLVALLALDFLRQLLYHLVSI